MFHVKQLGKHTLSQLDVSRETIEKMDLLWEGSKDQLYLYAERLLWWNKKINLLSRNITRSQIVEHVQHSLWITSSPFWDSDVMQIRDAGSGGGLPGIPLAITFPQKNFTLIDLVEKKTLATRQIIRDLGLTNVSAEHSSIEIGPTITTEYMYVSKHAFKLDDFFGLTSSQTFNKAIFLKGDSFEEELDNCSRPLDVKIFSLESLNIGDFYSGKFVLSISRLAD